MNALQVARDYLLEHWEPEPENTPVYFTWIIPNHLLKQLPHYSLSKADNAFPRFTARQVELLAEIGINLVIDKKHEPTYIRVEHCYLRNWT